MKQVLRIYPGMRTYIENVMTEIYADWKSGHFHDKEKIEEHPYTIQANIK